MDIITYALSKKIAAHALSGVQSMSVSGQTLTINTKDSGVLTMTFPTPKDGVSVTDIDVNANNQIVFIMSDGTEFISGKIPTVKGDKGDAGFSPTITENADNTDKIYKLDITTADSTFTTPNLKGADGTGGEGASTWSEISDKPFESLSTDFSVENGELKVVGETGEENTIESISVNGTPISIDENKNVDITVPKVTNDLTDELKSSYDDAVTAKHTHDNKTVLDGITAEKVESWDKAEENIQSDWNETDNTADGFIKNKPTIPDITGLATETYVDNKVADYTKTVDLADVATSGSYNDLADKPTIPSLDGYAKTSEIPSKVSELENDSNYLSSIPEEYVTETELSAKGYLTEHQDISGKVDKVEGKSLISDTEIARLATVNNYDDTDIKAEIAKKADTTAIPNKVSELTNDSNYQTAEQVNSTVTTEIAKVVADAPEDLNTLKEMSDWIAGHEDDASAMNSAISDNKTAITALQTGKADKSEIPTTVAELTDSDDYAKTADIPTTDDTLSSTSTNPVQNKVVKAYVDKKASENVDFSTSTSKLLNDTVEAPLVLNNATRNLLNPSLLSIAENDLKDSGITAKINSDGSITLNGTATRSIYNVLYTTYGSGNNNMFKGLRVFTNLKYNGSNKYGELYMAYCKNNDGKQETWRSNNNGDLIPDGNGEPCWVRIHITSGATFNNETFFIMLTDDEEGAVNDKLIPYSGYDIKTCGKNLLNLTKITTNNTGVTASLSNGIITLDGTVDTSGGWQDLYFNTDEQYISLKRGVKYTISTKDKVQKVFLMLRRHNGLEIVYSHDCSTNGTTFVASKDMVCKVTITFKESSTFNNTQIAPQIEVGEKATEYEPYQDGGSVNIDSTTKFPLLGLKSFDGETNIISPGNVEVTYAKSDSGKAILDMSENKLDKDNVVNNQTTTEAGFALDARQANPNIDGSLAKQISDLNGSLEHINRISTTFRLFANVPLLNGIHVFCVNGGGNPVTDSPYPDVDGWWNVICFGVGGAIRMTQITSQAFKRELGYKGKDELWIRSMHDDTWSEWVKL